MLCHRLRDLREDRDISQAELAKAIGITQRKYSYIETGTQQLTADILILLSDYFEVSIDSILCQMDDPTPIVRKKQLLILG